MRYNGLCLIIDMAADALGDAVVTRHKKALLLGAIREDYWYLPGLGAVVESPSLEHFYGPGLPGGFIPFLTPGTRTQAPRFYRSALALAKEGRLPAAFVQLGRAAHLLIDMACPVHVHRVAHWSDPYEWYVEAHRDALAREPVPPLPRASSVVELIEGLSLFTQGFRPDRTNNLTGYLLRRVGLRRPLPRVEVAEQARRIVPQAASYTAALFALFLREGVAVRQAA
jgi:hypothetical protein